MDAKRWSPLWIFGAGCLSGAVFIGWYSDGAGRDLSSDAQQPASTRVNARAAERTGAPRVDHVAQPVASNVAKPLPSAQPDREQREESATEDSKSVADVLARLEAEYRQRNAPPRAVEPSTAPSAVVSTVASLPPEATRTLPNESSREHARNQEAAKPSSARARLDEPRVEEKPPTTPATNAAATNATAVTTITARATAAATTTTTASTTASAGTTTAAEDAVKAVLLGASDVQEKLLADASQQRISAQLQQVTALQQAAVVQQAALAQQFAMLQYLQLLLLSSTPRVAIPPQIPQRSLAGRRIVDTLPSSISATDNPWAFNYPPPVLLR
ncbi:MAG: hypothetical protein ACOY0T_17060 [Myxococcota bacterium]